MLLITPAEIISLAFCSHEKISPESIRTLKIDIAEQRYIRPRIGDHLFDALSDGIFSDFTNQYIKPALAHFVRHGIIDELSIGMSDNGALVYGSTLATTDKNSGTDSSQKQIGSDSSSVDEDTLLSSNLKRISNEQEQIDFSEDEFISSSTNIQQQGITTASTNTLLDGTHTDTRTDKTTVGWTKSERSDLTTTLEQTDTATEKLSTTILRAASTAERRLLIDHALWDANVLLAKAVRYIERNADQFPLYVGRSLGSRFFF